MSAPLTKLYFKLDASDWHGYETESMWAESIGGNRYRLRNTPFFAKEVSFEDIVFVQEYEGDLFFESTSIAAGHSTYRILIEKTVANEEFLKYWKPIEEQGCSYESADRATMDLLAVDVPSSADIHKVYELLDIGEKKGIWDFEEGHCGHAV